MGVLSGGIVAVGHGCRDVKPEVPLPSLHSADPDFTFKPVCANRHIYRGNAQLAVGDNWRRTEMAVRQVARRVLLASHREVPPRIV